MSELERIIAERDRLNKIIDEYCVTKPTGVIPTIGQPKSLKRTMLEMGGAVCESSSSIGDIVINIDNSTKTTTHREVNTNTTLAGGDSALGMLGGLIGKLF